MADPLLSGLLAKLGGPKSKPKDDSRSQGNGPVIGPWLDGSADGELRYISPSQMERFDPASEGGCERKWWFRYHARLPDRQTKAKDLGTQVHAQLEHYLKTGDSVLGDLARAGARFIPQPGGDLLVEAEYGDPEWPGPLAAPVVSPLAPAGVPMVLKIDLLHRRGWFLTDAGVLVREPPRTAEVRDWKTTKQIDDVFDEDGCRVKQGYAKQGDALIKTWQMPAYGALALTEWPDTEHVRLSHGYFQTQGERVASLRSALHTAAEIRARWDAPAEALVERMKSVARIERAEDVPKNTGSCNAYGGCPFRQACPRTKDEVLKSALGGRASSFAAKLMAGKDKPEGERLVPMASLLDKFNNGAKKSEKPETPPRAEVDAEKAKLLAAEAARRGGGIEPPDKPAPVKTHEPHAKETTVAINVKVEAACGHMCLESEVSRLPDGTIKHIGCKATAEQQKLPEVKMEVEFKPGEACPIGGTQVKLDTEAAVEKKYLCQCGYDKPLKVKPQKLADGYYALVPKHDVPGEPEPEVEETSEPEPEPAKADNSTQPEVAAAYALKGRVDGRVDLYLDAIEDGVVASRLEDYVAKLARALADEYKAADVRCAPEESPLAFSKWRGALAAVARTRLPDPGAYVCSSADEVAMVVFRELATMKLGRVVRGIK